MFRKIALITVAALLLTGGIAAAAVGQYKTIRVYMGKLIVAVNGNGAEVPNAIVYNGTVYLPADEIGDMLGADVILNTDPRDKSVSGVYFDYRKTVGGAVIAAADYDIYQYMFLEKNQIMEQFVKLIKNKNYAGMRPQIERLNGLSNQAIALGDDQLKRYLSQMAFSAEVIRSGLQTKTAGSDYKLAVTLFLRAESDYTEHIKSWMQTQIDASETIAGR